MTPLRLLAAFVTRISAYGGAIHARYSERIGHTTSGGWLPSPDLLTIYLALDEYVWVAEDPIVRSTPLS